MGSDRILDGTICQCDTPDWTALEDLHGIELVGRFMWMFEVELEDRARVHAYKDRITRRYFHLADHGRAFYYVVKGRYREVDRCTAIMGVFEESPDWTEAEEEAYREALSKARAELNGL